MAEIIKSEGADQDDQQNTLQVQSQPQTETQTQTQTPQHQYQHPQSAPTASSSGRYIPPPPTVQQQQQHQQQQHNLQHPPGYIQNPTLTTPCGSSTAPSGPGSGPGPAPANADLSALGLKGRWIWDPAPGEAGGRYVYQYVDEDFEGGVEPVDPPGYGYGYGKRGYGDGNGNGNGDEGGPAEWVSGMWETTMGWARTAGTKVVQAEEGIWRWVNSKT